MNSRLNIAQYRGRIIERCTVLESVIEEFISNHFTNDHLKRDELQFLILSCRMTFESKRQVFEYLLNTYNKEALKGYPALLKDIQTIIEQRNVFAHYPAGIYGVGNGTVESVLFKLKNTLQLLHYDKPKLDEIILTIKRCIKYVEALNKKTSPSQ